MVDTPNTQKNIAKPQSFTLYPKQIKWVKQKAVEVGDVADRPVSASKVAQDIFNYVMANKDIAEKIFGKGK